MQCIILSLLFSYHSEMRSKNTFRIVFAVPTSNRKCAVFHQKRPTFHQKIPRHHKNSIFHAICSICSTDLPANTVCGARRHSLQKWKGRMKPEGNRGKSYAHSLLQHVVKPSLTRTHTLIPSRGAYCHVLIIWISQRIALMFHSRSRLWQSVAGEI